MYLGLLHQDIYNVYNTITHSPDRHSMHR